jgi:hypothetical protein
MKVLVACEYSGVVRDAFIKGGHDAISCDLLPTDSDGPHYQGDVFDIINDGFDLMIAHPPCTYLANSGVSRLYSMPGRWDQMKDGALFFKRLLEADIPKKCIENPIMHKYAKEVIGSNYTQIVHPWMFGHPEKKATCLWLRNLPKIEQTNNVKEYMETLPKNKQNRMYNLPETKDRWKLRSITYSGLADAMAEQWGKL